MPKEGTDAAAPGPYAENKETKRDLDTLPWIRNLAALIAIVVAIVGAWKSLEEIRLTAVANRDAEQTKRVIAEKQIADQVSARGDQYAFERDKQKSDIQNQKNTATEQQRAKDREVLSSIINHMFLVQSGSEADLAALFNFVDRDAAANQTIENAVLARLENPRSDEEIDLGFRLLERIGVRAIDATVQANRTARKRYDSYLTSTFCDQFHAKWKQGDHIQRRETDVLTDPSIIEPIEKSIAAQFSLKQRYVFALLNSVGGEECTDTELKENENQEVSPSSSATGGSRYSEI